MAATKRPRKPIDIKIDTKNIDVEIHRDIDGNVNASIDTKVVDVEIKKDIKGWDVDVHLDDNKEYEFESNGKSDHLPKGTIWKITGEFLKIFLKQGLGKLKK